MLDHDKLVALHAAQAPWWEPGIAVRLPRDQPGIPARRDRQARVGPFARHVLRRRGGGAARRRLPHRHGSRARRPHRPCDPAGGGRPSKAPPAISIRLDRHAHDAESATRRPSSPRRRNGGAPRSPRPAVTATPVRWRCATRPRRAAGRRAVSRCCPRRAWRASSTSSIRGVDLVLGAEVVLGMGFGLPGPMLPVPEPAHGVLGRVGRLAGDRRRRRQDELQLRDEPDGRGHDRRHPRRRTPDGRLRRADVAS